MTTNPQPRIDESGHNAGVPVCVKTCCHWSERALSSGEFQYCGIEKTATTAGYCCLPAVRQMAAKLEKSRRMLDDLRDNFRLVNCSCSKGTNST